MPLRNLPARMIWIIMLLLSALAVAACASLVLAVSVMHSNQTQLLALVKQGKEAHDGVCALRHNLEVEVQASVDYLVKHPEGAPALGLTRADILRSIDRERKTIESLRSVHC